MNRIILSFCILFSIGCGTYPNRSIRLVVEEEWVDGVLAPRTVTIGGEGIEPHHITAIADAMKYLPANFYDLDLVFYIMDGGLHLDGEAHAHILPNNLICMRHHAVNTKTVWHEVAHALAHELLVSSRKSFYKEWKKIAGDVYGDQSKPAMQDGVLTPYSRKNHAEDVADFFQECRYYLHKDRFYHLSRNQNLKSDDRYRKKLDLLYAAGFFDEMEYSQLKPLFAGQ